MLADPGYKAPDTRQIIRADAPLVALCTRIVACRLMSMGDGTCDLSPFTPKVSNHIDILGTSYQAYGSGNGIVDDVTRSLFLPPHCGTHAEQTLLTEEGLVFRICMG